MKDFSRLLLVLMGWTTACLAPAQSWLLVDGTTNTGWPDITSSADGSKLAAAGYNGTYGIYLSTNAGATWLSSSAPNMYWSSLASSADGTKLAAAAYPQVYTSTNSGASWLSKNMPGAYTWTAIASSADGSKLIAAAGYYSGPVCVSTNSGDTWLQTSAPLTNWCAVASSADGNVLLAAVSFGPVYLSTNSGSTWVKQDYLPDALWTTMATSADGKILLAVASWVGSGSGCIYRSTNSGNAWIQVNAPTNRHWMTFCVSADGTKMAAIEDRLFAYSTNSGKAWVSNTPPRLSTKWGGLASSADGNKLVLAANNPGGIYLLQTPPVPKLNLETAGTNLKLSWIVPATDFVPQRSADLAGWSDVTNVPVLNLTNLQNEVFLPPTGNSSFYRLKTP